MNFLSSLQLFCTGYIRGLALSNTSLRWLGRAEWPVWRGAAERVLMLGRSQTGQWGPGGELLSQSADLGPDTVTSPGDMTGDLAL